MKTTAPTICACTVFTALALALMAGCGKKTPDNILARVGGENITVEDFQNELQHRTANRLPIPAREQLLGMFEVLREWFVSPDFHGCAFLNASGEIGCAEDPIRVVAREHKAQLLQFIRVMCDAYVTDTGRDTKAAASLARQWLILIDGAIGVALVSGSASAARDARAAAMTLLDARASV